MELIQAILHEMGIHLKSMLVLWCDNQSAGSLASNLVFHARTKHIKVYVHFIRDHVLSRILKIPYLPSVTDLF